MAVTVVTAPDLRRDDYADEYRNIYDELRERRSLAQFVELTGTTVSRAWWSQYEAGVKHLDWQRKNELRRAVGLPLLAPPVAAACADVSPEATVWRIGEGVPDRILQVGCEAHASLLLRVNGDVHVIDGPEAERSCYTRNIAAGANVRRSRRAGKRVELPAALHAALNERRRARGLSWAAFLGELLEDA